MTLDPSVPGGMVPYRRTLTLSLFYKFYLTVLQKLREQVCNWFLTVGQQKRQTNVSFKTFICQGVNVEEVSSDCLSATEVYRSETPSSVQIYQVPPHTHTHW